MLLTSCVEQALFSGGTSGSPTLAGSTMSRFPRIVMWHDVYLFAQRDRFSSSPLRSERRRCGGEAKSRKVRVLPGGGLLTRNLRRSLRSSRHVSMPINQYSGHKPAELATPAKPASPHAWP
jgi:hypothetical protein